MSTLADTTARIDRRRFCRALGGWLAAPLALTGQTGPCRAWAADGPRATRYVDIHTHVGTIKAGGEVMTAELLLRWMDAHDVAQAIVLPLVSPESFQNPVPTEVTLDQTRPYRDRLIPFCSIDPRNSWINTPQRLAAQLKRYVDDGARGFGEHKPGLPIDDPRSLEIYAVCAELKLPLLIHLDNQRNTDAPGLPGLEKVLQTFPQGRFIGHGPGWWASISGDATQADLGGYPRSAVQPGGAIDVLMDKYPNLYGDLSAGSGSSALKRDLQFARDFVIRRADRLLFGTDYLGVGQQVEQFEVLASLDLPSDVQQRVFRSNARKLLGIEPA